MLVRAWARGFVAMPLPDCACRPPGHARPNFGPAVPTERPLAALLPTAHRPILAPCHSHAASTQGSRCMAAIAQQGLWACPRRPRHGTSTPPWTSQWSLSARLMRQSTTSTAMDQVCGPWWRSSECCQRSAPGALCGPNRSAGCSALVAVCQNLVCVVVSRPSSVPRWWQAASGGGAAA